MLRSRKRNRKERPEKEIEENNAGMFKENREKRKRR
jgi:hypothetical protein